MATPDDDVYTQEKSRGSSRLGKFLRGIIITILVLGLGAAVLYLLSEINHGQYRLVSADGMLIVERGRFMPVGFEPYRPEAEDLKAAYAPIPLPEGESLSAPEVFRERIDLDRTLFSLLAGWARRGLDSQNPAHIETSTRYVERCEMLPGLSEEQRNELTVLRADLAFLHGLRLLDDVAKLLRDALERFETALKAGTSQPDEAQRWIDEINARIADYSAKPRTDASAPAIPDSPAAVESPVAEPTNQPAPQVAPQPLPQRGSEAQPAPIKKPAPQPAPEPPESEPAPSAPQGGEAVEESMMRKSAEPLNDDGDGKKWRL